MTDEILPLGYPPKTRRVCQPYIDQIAALSASLADAEANINIKAAFIDNAINMHAADSQRIYELEAALATARADALREAAKTCRETGHSGIGAQALESHRVCEHAIRALIPATPPAKGE